MRAYAGIQVRYQVLKPAWIPASAGMTGKQET
jgi:hypothetical protein